MSFSDDSIVDRVSKILADREYIYTRANSLLALSFAGEPTEIRLVIFAEPERDDSKSYLVCLGALQIMIPLLNRGLALEFLNESSLKAPLGGYELRADEHFATATFKYGFEVFDGNLTHDMVESAMARVLAALREVEKNVLLLAEARRPAN